MSTNLECKLTNQQLLHEICMEYAKEINPTLLIKEIVLPKFEQESSQYMKQIDGLCEQLDYIHISSNNMIGKVIPQLLHNTKQLRSTYQQIDAIETYVQSVKRKVDTLEAIIRDVNLSTKKYSKFVPKFLRKQPSRPLNEVYTFFNQYNFELNADQFITTLKELNIDSNHTEPSTLIDEHVTTSSENLDNEQLNHETIDNVKEEEEPSSPVQSAETMEDDEDEGEVIIGEGEEDEEDEV